MPPERRSAYAATALTQPGGKASAQALIFYETGVRRACAGRPVDVPA
jgi:hypothetical protein